MTRRVSISRMSSLLVPRSKGRNQVAQIESSKAPALCKKSLALLEATPSRQLLVVLLYDRSTRLPQTTGTLAGTLGFALPLLQDREESPQKMLWAKKSSKHRANSTQGSRPIQATTKSSHTIQRASWLIFRKNRTLKTRTASISRLSNSISVRGH